MSLSRKKPLTEVEKLMMTNCIGRQFVQPRLTEIINNDMSDTNNNSNVHLNGIRQNLTNRFDDEETSSSEDSSFADEASEVDDEIIKDLPDDTVNNYANDEVPDKYVIFPAEMIEKLKHGKNDEVTNEEFNLWDDVDNIHESSDKIVQDAQFANVLVVLVDDDDSVLFPFNQNNNNN